MGFLSGLFSSASDKDSRAGFWQSMLGGFGGNSLGLTANIMGLTQEADPTDDETDDAKTWKDKENIREANRKRRAQTAAVASAANLAAVGGDVAGLVQNERNYADDDYSTARGWGRAEGSLNLISHAADALGSGTAALQGFGVFGKHKVIGKDGKPKTNPDGSPQMEDNFSGGTAAKIKKFAGIGSGAVGILGNFAGVKKANEAYKVAMQRANGDKEKEKEATNARRRAWAGTGFGFLGNVGKIVSNVFGSGTGAYIGKGLSMLGQLGGMVTNAVGVGHTARKKGASGPRRRIASSPSRQDEDARPNPDPQQPQDPNPDPQQPQDLNPDPQQPQDLNLEEQQPEQQQPQTVVPKPPPSTEGLPLAGEMPPDNPEDNDASNAEDITEELDRLNRQEGQS